MGWLPRKAGLKKTRVKTSPEKRARNRIEKELSRLCRILVVEIRDGNRCQRCGAEAERSKIDWSHVVTRGAKSIKWTEWNSKALCAGCHQWWGGHPIEASEWWREKYPEREIQRLAWKQQRKKQPIQHELIRLYLIQKIQEAGRMP